MLSSEVRADSSTKVDKSIGRCAVSREVAAGIMMTDTKASYTPALDRAKLAATREWQWRQVNRSAALSMDSFIKGRAQPVHKQGDQPITPSMVRGKLLSDWSKEQTN